MTGIANDLWSEREDDHSHAKLNRPSDEAKAMRREEEPTRQSALEHKCNKHGIAFSMSDERF